MEIQDDADLDRFAKLGVIANYTPWWHAGDKDMALPLLGKERASKLFRCKTLWDSGALVTWSSDNIVYMNFVSWVPYLGMEIGMTRRITEKTKLPEFYRTDTVFPSANERIGIEEMILGYTINGAKQLGIEASKGSNKPQEVYFGGKRIKK